MRLPRVKLAALILLAVTVGILALALFLGRASQPPSPEAGISSSPFDPRAARTYWTSRIRTAGGADAWAELKKTYANSGPGIQHTAAHLFGSLLYEAAGEEGIGVCDAAFAFGCYHSFFGGALAEKGLEIVPSLVRECRERLGAASLGCEHGIGHGLMEFLGPHRFREALAACPPETNPFRGCAAGVFMEYNVPMALDGDLSEIAPRTFDPARPYDPCPTVPESFQAACYHELPPWWRQIYGLDTDVLRGICMKIAGGSDREACLLGIPIF
jgi:hypothetical protein